MAEIEEKINNGTPPVANSDAAIQHFQQELAFGKHWYIALLEAIGLWTDEGEIVQGRDYNYLIDGEAFDWLLLAQRLCDTVHGLIPEDEKHILFSRYRPPLNLNSEEIKRLIGPVKYHMYLNYFYGVIVEEALIQAVREEVFKERQANCWKSRHGEEDEVFNRVYGVSHKALLRQFRKEKHYHQLPSSNLTALKEFAYWRFKYRVRSCEKAKVASDTHKGLEWLRKNGYQS
jgi:hypothetical protein